MKKYILLLGFIIIVIFGCQQQTKNNSNSKVAKETTAANATNAKNAIDLSGIYKGILPCADCDGLETEITINENATFCLKTKYQGKGNKVFEQKGTFTWNKAGNIIIFSGIKNAPNKYFVSKNRITQLDMSGKKIVGSLTKAYILSKQAIDTTTIETADLSKSTVNLNNRMEATTVIQKVNPAVGKSTLAETTWKLIVLNKKIVVQNGRKPYFLKLNSKDGKFSAYIGCKAIIGRYVMASANTLAFSEVGPTKKTCPNLLLETNFITMLEKTNSYVLDKETLTLYGKGKVTLARFEAIK